MMDFTAIAQSTPGAMAVNASILVGYRMAGGPGALVTVGGTVLPPLIIISVISLFYQAFRANPIVNLAMTGMLAGVAAVLCDVVYTMARSGPPAGEVGAAGGADGPLLPGGGGGRVEPHPGPPPLRRGGGGPAPGPPVEGEERGAAAVIYLELLWSFIQIGLFSIGGGYAAMPLIQHQVVDLHPWLTMTQFADVIAIAEMTPGPIALNAATFVGIQVAGLPGALVATAGSVLPSCVIVLLLAFLYYKFKGFSVIQGILAGVRPAVVAMIASAGVSMVLLAVYGTRTCRRTPRPSNGRRWPSWPGGWWCCGSGR